MISKFYYIFTKNLLNKNLQTFKCETKLKKNIEGNKYSLIEKSNPVGIVIFLTSCPTFKLFKFTLSYLWPTSTKPYHWAASQQWFYIIPSKGEWDNPYSLKTLLCVHPTSPDWVVKLAWALSSSASRAVFIFFFY